MERTVSEFYNGISGKSGKSEKVVLHFHSKVRNGSSGKFVYHLHVLTSSRPATASLLSRPARRSTSQNQSKWRRLEVITTTNAQTVLFCLLIQMISLTINVTST